MPHIFQRSARQRLIISIAMMFGVVFATSTVGAQTSLRIAAVVNEDVISAYDLSARVWMTIVTSGMKNTPENQKRLASQTLSDLINDKLKLQESKSLKIKVSEEELQDAFRRIEKRNKLPIGGIDGFLEQQGIDKTSLSEQIEADLSWKKLVSRRLGRRVTITNEEIDERIALMAAAKGLPERRLGEIYLPVDSTDKENEVAQLAHRLYDILQKKKNFSEVARTFSRSPSAAIGGDLGWVREGQLHPDLEKVISQLKPNTLSRPTRALGGYYLFVVTDSRVNAGTSSTDKTTVSLQQLFLALPANAPSDTVSQTLARATALAAPATTCADMEKISRDSASSLSGSLGTIKLNSLPDALRSAVQDLPTGEPSPPIQTTDGVIVLMVCSRQGENDQASLRKKIKDDLFEQRITALAEEYLRDLRRKAFVDIRL